MGSAPAEEQGRLLQEAGNAVKRNAFFMKKAMVSCASHSHCARQKRRVTTEVVTCMSRSSSVPGFGLYMHESQHDNCPFSPHLERQWKSAAACGICICQDHAPQSEVQTPASSQSASSQAWCFFQYLPENCISNKCTLHRRFLSVPSEALQVSAMPPGSCSRIVHKSGAYMQDEDNLREALRYSATLLGELRTPALTPQRYFELYMQAFNELTHLQARLGTQHSLPCMRQCLLDRQQQSADVHSLGHGSVSISSSWPLGIQDKSVALVMVEAQEQEL